MENKAKSGLVRSLFNAPTTQLPTISTNTLAKARHQLEKWEGNQRTSEHPLWKHFSALPVSVMHA